MTTSSDKEERLKKLSAELDALTSEDSEEFLLNLSLTTEINELLKGEIAYGDGDITVKARRVLEVGANQILQGKSPSPDFIRYVAICITKALEDQTVSLDQAFRIKNSRGRPQKDPQEEDHIIDAFLKEIYISSKAGAYSIQEQQDRAFQAAYKAMHGKTIQEHKDKKFDPKSIDSYMTETRKLLHARGYYESLTVS